MLNVVGSQEFTLILDRPGKNSKHNKNIRKLHKKQHNEAKKGRKASKPFPLKNNPKYDSTGKLAKIMQFSILYYIEVESHKLEGL